MRLTQRLFTSPQPKSDISDFGQLIVPNSGKPEFGWGEVGMGALIAVALAIFLLNGGEHFGKKTVNSDADLPPVTTAR